MNRIKIPAIGLALLALSGCGASKEDYTAVYQVIPDAHVLYLGNHYFLAKDNDGQMYFIEADGFGEAAFVKKIF